MARLKRSDAELLSPEHSRGDFEAFYRRHRDVIAAYFGRRVREPDRVLDLVAETFARALQRRTQFDAARGPAVAWLLGIARNLLVDSVRSGQVEADARRRLGMSPISLSDSRLAQIDRQIGLDIDAVLGGLPDAHREAVRRRVLEDESYPSIATDLGCSEFVVRQRVSRGLATLRRTLKEHR